jgi:putative drug exporter of the RND superfamily
MLVPSIMELLGPVNWWMPKWMDRTIPTIGVEVTPDAPPGPDGPSSPGPSPSPTPSPVLA